MVTFSNDVDLLKWEPVLFRDLAPESQVLCRGGGGSLSGTTFTAAGGSFVDAQAAAGQVIHLRNNSGIDGCYEIVSVDGPTQLTLSVVRPNSDDDPVAPPAGNDLDYCICTFDPQAQEIAYSLRQYFGIEAVDEEGNPENEVLNQRSLRQASVFAVLAAVFAASGCSEKDSEGFWKKSLHYQKRFEKARTQVQLEIDSNGDGLADRISRGGSIRLRRG